MTGPAERPVPFATGTLAKTPFVNLLLYALERKLSGTMEVSFPGASTPAATILFRAGRAAKGRTSEPVAYLGRVMVDLGFLDAKKLDHSLAEMAQKKRLHGRILLEMGAISEAQLLAALREQLVRKVMWVAKLPSEATFAYYDAFDALASYGGGELVALDPFPLVAAAVRETPPWDHVHAALARLAASPLRLARGADLTRFELSDREKELIDVLRAHPLRVAELVATELLKPRDAQLLLYTLVLTKQVTVSASDAPATASVPPPPQSAPRLAPPTPAKAAPPPSPPQAAPTSGAVKTATPAASMPVIQAADPSPSPSPAQPVAAPAADAQAGPLTPELEARRKEILERAKFIDREDYFQMLDVDRSSTVDQARDAFLALAKTWHPDRLPAALASVKAECSRVFARMSEAHSTLVDEKRRANYMTLLTEGGATPESQATIVAVIEAATNFQKAEVLLRRNDVAQAEELCRKAVAADPGQPDYLALLVWIEATKPEGQTPAATNAAIARLGKAIEMSNRCERAYFYRGQLNKRLGNTGAAMRDFRRASELNPKNLDAVREVRLYEMRTQKGTLPPKAERESNNPPPTDKPGGLFGKLFKK